MLLFVFWNIHEYVLEWNSQEFVVILSYLHEYQIRMVFTGDSPDQKDLYQSQIQPQGNEYYSSCSVAANGHPGRDDRVPVSSSLNGLIQDLTDRSEERMKKPGSPRVLVSIFQHGPLLSLSTWLNQTLPLYANICFYLYINHTCPDNLPLYFNRGAFFPHLCTYVLDSASLCVFVCTGELTWGIFSLCFQ